MASGSDASANVRRSHRTRVVITATGELCDLKFAEMFEKLMEKEEDIEKYEDKIIEQFSNKSR